MISARKKALMSGGRAAEKYVFDTAGSDTSFTMPWDGFLIMKCWGGGAGGTGYGRGGNGGYARRKMRVAKGTVLNVRVASVAFGSNSTRYPGPGGRCSFVGPNTNLSSAWCVAGGGGAVGGTDTTGSPGKGGDATGPVADAGDYGTTFSSNAGGEGGGGGTQTSGGIGGIGVGGQASGVPGGQQDGGLGGRASSYGGSGGEGWYGGGGGASSGSNAGGGGGGSCKGDVMARLTDAASTGDPDYAAGFSAGTATQGANGQSGRVVLIVSSR